MKLLGTSRPSKSVSALGMLVGIIFILVGVFVFIPEAGLIGFFWTLFVFVMTGFHLFNLFLDKGVADEVHEIRVDGNELNSDLTVESRLKRLAKLREKNLVSEDEYHAQRKKILQSL